MTEEKTDVCSTGNWYIYSVMLQFHMITFDVAGTTITSGDSCARVRYLLFLVTVHYCMQTWYMLWGDCDLYLVI